MVARLHEAYATVNWVNVGVVALYGATTPTAAKESPLPSRCGGIGTVDVMVKARD